MAVEVKKTINGQAVGIPVSGSTPTDEVAVDNMHSVTSNAVARANSYSTEEHFTGKYWHNGKKIYERVFLIEHLANSSDVYFNISSDIDSLTKVDFVTSNFNNGFGGTWQFFHQGAWGTGLDWTISCYRSNNDFAVRYGSSYTPYDFTLQVSLEYTKTI